MCPIHPITLTTTIIGDFTWDSNGDNEITEIWVNGRIKHVGFRTMNEQWMLSRADIPSLISRQTNNTNLGFVFLGIITIDTFGQLRLSYTLHGSS